MFKKYDLELKLMIKVMEHPIEIENLNSCFVTFEQAEMLCKKFKYSKPSKFAYDIETKKLMMFPSEFNHNQNKTWQVTNGWKYYNYSAPTNSEAIEFLIEELSYYKEKSN